MRIQFIQDVTVEYPHEHKIGDSADLPDDLAQHLIDKGRAINADTGQGRPVIPPPVISSMKPVEVVISSDANIEIVLKDSTEEPPAPKSKGGKS